MDKKERKIYEAPYTKRCQVELEGGICVSSHTGKNVVDENNNKVNIEEQGHGLWDGTGNDINIGWEGHSK